MHNKTTNAAVKALDIHAKNMAQIHKMLRIVHGTDVGGFPCYVPPNKDERYWLGCADMANNFMEDILFAEECYHGYRYVCFKPANNFQDEQVPHAASSNKVTSADPGTYSDWCRQYFSL